MNKKLSEMKANRAKNTPHCNRPSAMYIFTRFSEKTSPGYFPLGFFFLSCVSPIKPKRGGSSYTVTGMNPLKTFYIFLWREELED